jgi:AcrR family transcriptional regulator
MTGRKLKVSPALWVETARRALVEEGIGGVKVERLAHRLGVTRGGFFHYFRDREALLDRLLEHWEASCKFLPDELPGSTPAEAVEWVDRVINRLIEEDGYDPRFDMAVREWARSDQRATWAVERADRQRLSVLERCFEGLGYATAEAVIRAKVFYLHQIGYYALGIRESVSERRSNVDFYSKILCGEDRLRVARAAATPRV